MQGTRSRRKLLPFIDKYEKNMIYRVLKPKNRQFSNFQALKVLTKLENMQKYQKIIHIYTFLQNMRKFCIQKSSLLGFYFKQRISSSLQQIYLIAMKAQALDAHSKLLQIESRLSKCAYLSKQPLPGAADALIFQKLKNTQKMPSKDRYFNFYHWYITMSQFALKEISKWIKDKESTTDDALINDSLLVIESLRASPPKKSQLPIDYIMNIFLKEPVESNLTVCKNKLLSLNSDQIGEELKISFKNYQERVNDYEQNSNELRIMFKLSSSSCERLKDIISKWPQVKNIQIKKHIKQKKQ